MQKTVRRPNRSRGGFTLVELLIVIGIIVLLISILIPVVSKVRSAGQNAAAQAFLVNLGRAIDMYEQDFKAYPGPLANNEIYNSGAVPSLVFTNLVADPTALDYDTTTWNKTKITMSENLVLGMLGGLKYDVTDSKYKYDPRLIGGGAFSLNTGTTKRYKPYVEAVNLSWRTDATTNKKTGQFTDEAGSADDSIIPEFVDTYPEPMPILYMRAKRGAAAAAGAIDAKNNTVVTYDSTNSNNRVGQYDLHQIIAYTTPATGKRAIGSGRKQIKAEGWGPTPPPHGLSATVTPEIDVGSAVQSYDPPTAGVTYKYPFDAYAYLRNQALSTPKESDGVAYGAKTTRNDVPHQKDGFILICAGADRIYGTRDDITNFGTVGQ